MSGWISISGLHKSQSQFRPKAAAFTAEAEGANRHCKKKTTQKISLFNLQLLWKPDFENQPWT